MRPREIKLTPLEKKVYAALLGIPLGEVRSYGWLARKVGKPRHSRAIGQILKRNPFPLFLPCHRIIKSSGQIGGYAFGAKTKKQLLSLERQIRRCLANRE
ncbi:MAG: MGMT family protein [Candidatus Omnitrophota bacterium]